MTDDAGLLEALRSQLPSMKTQGQATAFTLALTAFRNHVEAIFSSSEKIDESRALLDQAIEMLHTATLLSQQYEEVETAETATAKMFKAPPKDFSDLDTAKKLGVELASITDLKALSEWYAKTAPERNTIKTQALRDALFDAIRAKKSELLCK